MRTGPMHFDEPPTRALIEQLRTTDGATADALAPLLYRELHAIAARLLRGERPGHTLQPTALVHEAWVKLAGTAAAPRCSDDRHFLRLAARTMRRVLVDHARARGSKKRDPHQGRSLVDDWMLALEESAVDVLVLHEAVERLGAVDAWLAELVELRYFAGLSVPEAAQALGVSDTTVERGWRSARAWLRRELGPA